VLIEFIGLPGSGKTTIFAELAAQLHKERLRCNTLRMVARDRMEEGRTHIRFLQRRAERVGLYGCFSFAHEQPALFDALLQATRHDLGRTLWNMEMLAQIHFVSKQPVDDTLIFLDEGFLHRGVSAFSDRPDRAAFRHYLSCLTHDFITVHVETPLDVAIARAASRTKPVPFLGRAAEPETGMDSLQEFAELVQIACDTRRAAGKTVLTVNGMLGPDLAALQLAGAIKALATPAMFIPADVVMRKHRKKPSVAMRQA
jgi:predicted kinase